MKRPKQAQPPPNRNLGSHSVVKKAKSPSVPSLVDQTDLLLLDELQGNARVSFAELARRVHLSTPAVIDRIRRLEDTGVLLGYRAQVNAVALGLGIRAFVKVTVAGDRIAAFATLARSVPEIIECHRVTGNESFLAQVVVRDMDHLEQVLDALMPYVSTNTSIVLNSPVISAGIAPHTGNVLAPIPPGRHGA